MPNLNILPTDPAKGVSALALGAMSPLWAYYSAATVGGVAFWCMTRWAQPKNLEAFYASPVRTARPELSPPLEANETVETINEAVADSLERPVAVETIEPIPELAADALAPQEPMPAEASDAIAGTGADTPEPQSAVVSAEVAALTDTPLTPGPETAEVAVAGDVSEVAVDPEPVAETMAAVRPRSRKAAAATSEA